MQTHEKVEVIRLATGPQKPINEYKRFAILVLGSFGCIVFSFTYAWNLIAAPMQQRYNLSQRDMSSIVTTGLVFQYCVLPYAFLYDFLGPTPIAIIASTYLPLGTLLQALCFMGKIQGTVVRLCVFDALLCSGCILFDLCSCVTVLSHFPTNRGTVAALMKTYSGLGSALVAALYAGFFDSDPMKHFFFLCSLAVLVGLLCITFMRLPPYHLTQYEERTLPADVQESRRATKAQYLRQEAPLRRFVWGFFILFLLIVFLPTQSALVSYLGLGKGPKIAFAICTTVTILLYLLVAAPLRFMNSSYIPFLSPHRSNVQARDEGTSHNSSEEWQTLKFVLTEDFNALDRRQDEAVRAVTCAEEKPDYLIVGEMASEKVGIAAGEAEVDYVAPQYQGTFLHNLRTLELWTLWWTVFTIVGAEFVIIYNASFILTALQSAPVNTALRTMLTVLNGVGSAVGRLLMASLEIWSQKRKAEDRIPITVAVFVPRCLIITAIVMFLTLPARFLPLPYVVAALGNGFLSGATLLVTRTIFAKDPAKHYNFCFTATTVASILYNRFLYGEWYTVQAEKQARADRLCYGKSCVLMPLLVMLGLASSAFVTDVILHFRYRSYCQKTLAERARLREEAVAERQRRPYGGCVEDGALPGGEGSPAKPSAAPRKLN